MPTVPSYDHALASADIAPSVRMTNITTVTDEGENARAAAKSLDHKYDVLAAVIQDANEMKVKAAMTALSQFDSDARFKKAAGLPGGSDATPGGGEEGTPAVLRLLSEPASGRTQAAQPDLSGFVYRRGEGAQLMPDGSPVFSYYEKAYQQKIQALAGTIPDEAMRQKFVLSAAQSQAVFMGDLAQHSAKEYFAYRGGVIQDSVDTSMNRIVALARAGNMPDQAGSAAEQEMLNLIRNGQALADYQGIVDKTQRVHFVNDIAARTNANIIVALNQEGNPDAARQWFQMRQAQFSPQARDALEARIHATELSVIPARIVDDLSARQSGLEDGLKDIDARTQGDVREQTRAAWIDHVQQAQTARQARVTQLFVPVYTELAKAAQQQILVGATDRAVLLKPLSQEHPEEMRHANQLIDQHNAKVTLMQQETTQHIRQVAGSSDDSHVNASRLLSDVFASPASYSTVSAANVLTTLGKEKKLDPGSLQEFASFVQQLKDPKSGPGLLSTGRQILDYAHFTLALPQGSGEAGEFLHMTIQALQGEQARTGKAPDLDKVMGSTALRYFNSRKAGTQAGVP